MPVPVFPSELVDRDIYALGLTVYEALTGVYPWKSTSPPPATVALEPRELPGLSDLAPELTTVVLKAIAPKRAERVGSQRRRHPTRCLSRSSAVRSRRTPTRSSATC